MLVYTEIRTDNERYRLSALLHDGIYDIPSLMILDGDKELEFWDNPSYLKKHVWDWINYLENEDKEELDKLLRKDREALREMFVEAFKIGML